MLFMTHPRCFTVLAVWEAKLSSRLASDQRLMRSVVGFENRGESGAV